MKYVVITGAGGGLGSELVKLYLERGDCVEGIDLKESEKSIRAGYDYPDRYHFTCVDITSDDQVNAAAAAIARKTDHIDLLINAAGVLTKNGENHLEDFDISASLKVFDINALGPLRMAKAFLSLLKRGEDRVLVDISSEAGSMQTNNNYVRRYDYCMSKAAVNMQCVILQRYLRPDDIKVLAVHPGWMQTDMGGAKATVPPDESARGIAALAEKYAHMLDQPIYFDYNGTPRPW
jgi:NAD(P)-dependent dehydrogenase (short-subunit alcohol dehydrogenase family)